MNTTHLHLLLNHVPTVGTVIGVGLLLVSIVRRSSQLQQVSLEIFYLIALVTLPVYLTGVAAQRAIQDLPGVSREAIAAHQDAALLASVLVMSTGFLAWLALWHIRRRGQSAGWVLGSVVLSALLTLATVAPAATAGGEIRHPEIKRDEAPTAARAWVSTEAVEQWVHDSAWVWPAAETLHFLGLSLLLGVVLAVNIRLLGGMRGLSYSSLHRMLPWAVLGLGWNLFSGMLFFIAAPEQYISNIVFFWKMVCLMAAGAHLLYLTVFDRIWALQEHEAPATLDKATAITAMTAWVGVIYLGRMLPFLGDGF